MKALLAILTLVSISTTVFAANNCGTAAAEVAKMNLDSKAKAYGFSESNLIDSSLKQISSAKKDGSVIYTVDGYIYKAEYTVQVGLDSSCSVESVSITENK